MSAMRGARGVLILLVILAAGFPISALCESSGDCPPVGDPDCRVPHLGAAREQSLGAGLDFGPDSGLGLVAQKRSGIK